MNTFNLFYIFHVKPYTDSIHFSLILSTHPQSADVRESYFFFRNFREYMENISYFSCIYLINFFRVKHSYTTIIIYNNDNAVNKI